MAADTGNQTAVLNAIAAGQCLTLDELCGAMREVNRRNLINAAGRLVERGLIERVERGCYRLTTEGERAQAAGVVIKSGPRGPMQRTRPVRNSLNTRLWRAMRLLKKFTIPALLELAARDEKYPRSGAERFVRMLEAAGYLHRLAKREAGTSPTSNGFVRWSLVRDTGSLPPMPRKNGREIYDPNIGEAVPCRG